MITANYSKMSGVEKNLGKLYVCGTPIGNLEDCSIRLLKTLRAVDIIACEDTRHTIKLLNNFKIKNRLISYHQYSNKDKEDYIVEQIKNGKDVALVSDAGMPTISDPGEGLVGRAIQEEIEIEVIPGPSACTAALAISGLDSSSFVFEGFLANRRSKRLEKLKDIKDEQRTLILYEAPHRLLDTLQDIAEVLGEEREVAVARELTKKHQELKRGSVGEVIEYYQDNSVRGEICILISAEQKLQEEKDIEAIAIETRELIKNGQEKKEAFKMKAREYKVKKSDIYKYFIDNEW